jgi:hypothetical protein
MAANFKQLPFFIFEGSKCIEASGELNNKTRFTYLAPGFQL